MYSFRGSRGRGATMMGGLARYFFKSSNAFAASGVHLKGPDLFMILKNGSALSPNLEMNRPRLAIHPAKRCISLRR